MWHSQLLYLVAASAALHLSMGWQLLLPLQVLGRIRVKEMRARPQIKDKVELLPPSQRPGNKLGHGCSCASNAAMLCQTSVTWPLCGRDGASCSDLRTTFWRSQL